jgi:hypothetical protein
VGAIGVKKKKYSFHKRKQSVIDSKGSIPRIEKLLLKKFVRNVGVAKCCAMNCCQHFLHMFWSLSFEDRRAYGLDIPRRLHTKGWEADKNLSLLCIY